MREENLIHRSYSAYLNNEGSPHSLFHNCFHSADIVDWLIKQQLVKTVDDGLEIFQVLEKLKIIHHGKTHDLAPRQKGRGETPANAGEEKTTTTATSRKATFLPSSASIHY